MSLYAPLEIELANGKTYRFAPLGFSDGIKLLACVDSLQEGSAAAAEIFADCARKSLRAHAPEEIAEAIDNIVLGDGFDAVLSAMTFRKAQAKKD